MDDIEIKITFAGNLCGCEITRNGNPEMFEKLTEKEQIRICNSLAQSYNLFYKVLKERRDE